MVVISQSSKSEAFFLPGLLVVPWDPPSHWQVMETARVLNPVQGDICVRTLKKDDGMTEKTACTGNRKTICANLKKSF